MCTALNSEAFGDGDSSHRKWVTGPLFEGQKSAAFFLLVRRYYRSLSHKEAAFLMVPWGPHALGSPTYSCTVASFHEGNVRGLEEQ